MQQTIQKFSTFLSKENPRFLTDQGSVYPLQHNPNHTPLTDEEISFLNEKLGDLTQKFIEFYSKFNGGNLFVGKNDNLEMHNTFSFNLTPVNKMADVTEGFLDWFDADDLDDEASLHQEEIGISYEGTPPWWSFDEDTALVLAEYEYSAEYIYIALRGENRGAIYNFFHDGSWHNIIAKNFDDFLNVLMNDSMLIMQPYMNSFFANKGGKITDYKAEQD